MDKFGGLRHLVSAGIVLCGVAVAVTPYVRRCLRGEADTQYRQVLASMTSRRRKALRRQVRSRHLQAPEDQPDVLLMAAVMKAQGADLAIPAGLLVMQGGMLLDNHDRGQLLFYAPFALFLTIAMLIVKREARTGTAFLESHRPGLLQ